MQTPLVAEEGLIKLEEEREESEIESFKLKPSKKKSIVDESITLEQPISPTQAENVALETPLVTEEGVGEFEEQIESSFKLKPSKKKSLADESEELTQEVR